MNRIACLVAPTKPNVLVALSSLLVLTALSVPTVTHAANADACQPALRDQRTDFPIESRELGQSGTVQVRLSVGADGRVTHAAVARSSGFIRLDRAAIDSVRKYWRFDFASCGGDAAHQQYVVNVRFTEPKSATLSGTVDPRAVTQERALRANRQCNVVEDATGTFIYTCVDNDSRVAVVRDARLTTAPAK